MDVFSNSCISCQTVGKKIQPTGGILYENEGWILFLHSRPTLIAGQGFIVLKRHCESVANLTPREQETLGPIMAITAHAMEIALHAEKVHFGLYAEGVKHIHLHLIPRTANLPASNIWMVWLNSWRNVLQTLHLRRPISDKEVEAAAAQVREVLMRMD
ncbi:MAG TPA: HIT domain-containing protein [Aggregatilineaceae bacterium]|nr:HIT domain-containing protein [Aggregatilineaceae bacterium]